MPTAARAGRAQRRFGWLLAALLLLSSTAALATNIATSITASVNPVNVGGSTVLTVIYTNTGSGNNTATTITRTLTGLPAGLTSVAFGGNDAADVSYNSGTGAVTINSGVLTLTKNGSNLNFTMTFTVPASASNFLATSNFSATGPGGSPATDNVAITVTPVADVLTTLTGPSTVPNSATASFTVTYTNNGPSTASTVTRTVTVPTGATSIVATGGTVTGTGPFTITYPALGTLASAGTASFPFSYTSPVTGSTMNTVSNITTTTSQNGAIANDQFTVTTALANASPFMGVTLTSSSNPINAGNALTLTVGVTNTGSGAVGATGVTRTVTGLPTGLAAGAVTFTGTGATGATYNSGAGSVTFTGGSTTLAHGGTTLDFTINFTAPATPSATPFTAVATVSASNQTNTSNPTASLPQTITPIADVATTLTGPATAAQGGTVSFTVTYTNNGPSTAAGVTRTVTVPAGATSITAPGGTVSGAGPYTITYAPSGGTMTSGQSDPFTFSYVAPATGTTMNTVSNIATTTSQNGATANDQITVTTTLTGAADVTATISAPATAPAGSNVSFLSVITNTSGVNGAANLIVSVFMGTGLTGVSASNFGTYNSGTGFVTFPTQTLGAGGTFQPVIRRTVPASGTAVATVSTTSDSDPNAANNNGSAVNATATVVATQVADLSIAVSGPAGATPGSVLVYSVLLSNFGPSTATGATAQLVLTGSPTGVTVSSGSVAGSTVTLTVPGGTLASGASLSYTIRFTVPNNIGGTVGGTASATSTTTNGDPVAANNNGTAPASQVSTAIVTSTPSERCAIPGSSGSLTFTGTQNINTYYPGTANAAAGQTAVALGLATFSGTPATNIAVNDLVLIIQMQGAGIDQTNTNAYGSGYTTAPSTEGAGRGYLDANLTAGQYEYGVVATVTGNPATSITLVSALANSYQVAAASATAGVRTFQVIRVPQYQNLTLAVNLTAPAWNGNTGGVLALDVSGTLALGGFTIDMKGLGFRGGAGRQLTGAGGFLRTDYRTPNTSNINGSKGEGIAGTPRYLNPGGSAVTLLDLGATGGYPDGTTIGGGDNGRGAPGNAGGGGSDTDPAANDENTGGGGGSNGGIGGQGGNGWQSNLPYGGFGGSPFTQTAPSRLIMGGGGGAGTTNNGTVDTGNAGNNNVGGIAGNNVGTGGFTTSGAPGGGLVIARAANVSGTGTIDVSGADMNFVALNDGSGGGGAGGSVLLLSNNTAANALTSVTILASGGKGGTNNPGAAGAHGPGGGGSGGVAFTSTPVSGGSTFGAGANGTTTGGITYEAGPGTSSDAFIRATTGFDETPFLQSGANCVNDLTTTISGPTTLAVGAASGPYTVTFTNTGLGSAGNYLTRTVTLPTGASLSSGQQSAITTAYPGTTFSTVGSGAGAVTTISFGAASNQVYNNTASYVFYFTAPAATGTPSLGSALTVSPTFGNASYTNEGANVNPNAATLALNVVNTLVTGTVYEDVNYGGGLGRDYATANASSGLATGAIRRAGAIVELYNTITDAYVSSTITDANGLYTFPATASTGYTVRVLNSSVTSVRTGATFTGSAGSGYTSNQVAVQTFNGTTDRVGGEYPGRTSAPTNTTGANLSTLTTGSQAAQSLGTVTSGANNTTTAGPNFGFNFDLVVNTNDSGQGSLRQFILNSNALGGEGTLTQSGSDAAGTLPAGKESSIFMIPNGATTGVPAGLRAYNASTNPGLASQLTGGVAVITPATALPAISSPNTYVDGSTQTFNIGNSNNVALGTGGFVGALGTTALGTVNGPEVQLVGSSTVFTGLDIAAGGAGTNVIGLAIYGFGAIGDNNNNAGIRVAAGGVGISRNVIGSAATSFSDPGAGIRGLADGIRFTAGTTASTVSNNLIGFNSGKGVATNGGVTNVTITGNEIRGNAIGDSSWDGIDAQGSSATITNNLAVNNAGVGIDGYRSAGSNIISGNTVQGNGRGPQITSPPETPGIRIYGANNTISTNLISDNYGAGIMLEGVTNAGALAAASGTVMSQNSIYNNGNVTTLAGGAASGQVGIDLENDGNDEKAGTSPYVTLNSATTTGANGLVNYPVLTSATLVGTNLVLKGFAKPNASIELYLGQANPAGVNATGANFGQGKTYLNTVAAGATGGASYSGNINGFNQGSDTNANAFTFSIPLSAAQQALVLAGTKLTATATLSGATSEFSGLVNVNTAPVPNTLTNASIPNTGGATVLNPNLSGTANGTFNGGANSISHYTVTALPASGTLTYNGTALTTGNIAATQISNVALLTYTPVSGFTGSSVNFAYTATDANGVVSTTNNNAGSITAGVATYTIPVLQVADVTTSIVATPSGSVNAGAGLSFAVTLANNGPNTAVGYTQTLTLTAGLGAGNVTFPTLPAGVTASYNNGTGVVTFTGLPATLASGSNLNMVVNIAVVPVALASVNASTTIGTSTPQGADTGPNSASNTVAVTPVADVLTTITGPTTIALGQTTGNYTATFTNNGPSTATSVPRTVALPTGATLSAAQVSNLNTTYGLTGNGLNTGSYTTTGSGNSAVTTINFGTLTTQASAGTASFVFAFTAPLTAGAASIASNTGTGTSQNGATGNDVSTLPLTVAPVADVTTTINGPTQLGTGTATGTYTVTYANVGSAAASTVTRTVTLPTGASLSAAQVSALNTTYSLTGNGLNTGSYTTTGSGTSAVTTIDFGNVGSLAAGASSSFAVTFTAPAAAGGVTVVSNTSTTTSEGNNIAPNSSTINATVNAVADVVATISPITGSVASGTAGAGFNVSFANNGTLTPAAGVTRTVQLPAGLTTYGAVTATNGGTYNNATGLVTYTPTPTTIANGTPLTSVIIFTAPPSGPVAATATVNTTSNEAGQTANNTASSSLTITPSFDLKTTIYGPGTVVQGNQVVLNVTTTNNGPSASTATQKVQLIAGLTNVFVSNGGTYDGTSGLVTFPAIASLPSGQTVGNTISFTAPTAGTALAPVATVTPNTAIAGETNITNNTAYLNGAGTSTNIIISAPTTLLANVYTTVSASPQSVAAGSPVTVTVTQGNAGPTAASNVIERVQLLPGLTITTLPAGAAYNSATGLLTLPNITSQASGASTSYTIVFTAPANAGNNGQILISASATTQTSETVLADNVASTVVTVVPTADVATAVSGPANASAGQQLTYTASFANNGPGLATSVTRTVQLPAGLSTLTIIDVATGLAAGTYNSSTGLVTLATLATQAPGTSSTFTLSFVAPATNFTVRSATGSTTVDGVPANNASSVSTTVANAADVAVVITAPATAVVGNPVTYFVTTTNNGPNRATGVAATLQLPANLTGVTVSGTGTYNGVTGLVTFASIGDLNSGVGVGNYVTFTMPNAAGGQLAGVATVTSTTTDPIAANNSASAATSVAPTTGTTADVATTVSAPASVAAGTSMTVTATFTNNGPDPAINVAPTLQLPAGLTGVVVSNSGIYNSANGVVTWPLIASQANGNMVSYTATFPAPVKAPVRATSAVGSQTSDNVLTNNSATTTTTISAAYDAITSISGPASSLPGVTNTYSVTATNNGPSSALSMQQTVTLPSGVTATNISGGGTQTGTTITWTALLNLIPGAGTAVIYAFDIAMPAAGNLALTANVSTGASETNSTNNSANLTTTRGNQPPVAQNVVNSVQSAEGNTAGQLPISPLAATDADGTVANYQLTSIPDATTQGVLYYDNAGTYTAITTANFAALNLTPTQAATLKFDPASTLVGNVFFNCTATDNLGSVSQPALYTIPVANDTPALYTVAPPKGGNGNGYVNNDILASVFDVNGGSYTSGGLVTYNAATGAVTGGDNGTRTVTLTTGPLPAGTTLNPVTGLITVADRTVLVPGSYPLTITTTDVYGGVTVHNIALVIGGSPVAVDDFATTNVNTPVTFAVAGNDLANGGAPIAPGTIDLDPNTAGIQTSITTGQGTFTTVGAPTGSVTFTPTSPTFSGTATTPYVIGNTATPSAISNQANLVVTVRPPAPVDLSVIISGTPSPVLAGGTVTFTATTTNNSTTTASPNTVSTVQLPTGLSAATLQVNSLSGTVSGSNINFAGGTYNTTTGLLTLTTATLTAGQASATTVSFPAPATGPVVATASTGNGTLDPTPANNTATANVPVTPQFDLVTTLDGPATVVQGGLATFTLTSRNNGPSPVPNAVQTAQFPTGLSGVFVTNGGYYNPTGASQTVYIVNGQTTTTTNPGGGATAYAVPAGGVLFPPMALANGQAVTNSVSFVAPATNFSPSAVISPNTSGAGDTNTANNTAFLNGAAVSTPVTVTTPAAAVANLYVTLTGPANVTPGQTGVTYTLTQGNNGPNTATNVATQVSLPTGLNSGSLTVGGVSGSTVGNNTTFVLPGGTATYSSVTGLLTLPDIASQASAASTSLSIVLTAPLSGPSYNLTASTAATTTDPVPADNVASLMTNLTPSTDVATTITGPATATAGQTVTYQVTTTNTTTAAAATRVAQVVTLPAGLSASSLRLGGLLGTLGGTVISFADGSTYDVTSGILTLPVLATLPGGTSQVTSISFPAPGNLPSMTPAVRVTSLSPDGVLTNNASTTTTTLSPLADVVVAVTGPANAIIGNPVTYVVTTTNNGPSSAASQTTTVQLPTGLSGVVVHDNSGAVVSGAYNATTGIVTLPTVTNQLPGQTNAQTGTITFVAPNTPRLNVAGVASVTNATGDPNLSNNVATAVTTLGAANPTTADVAVTLVPDVTTQTAGSPVVYTLTTQNNTAANPASNVTRAVTLPAGLSTTTLALNGTTSSSQTGNVITYVGGPNNGAIYDVTTGVLTLPAIASLVNGTPVLTTITVTTADVNPLVASATVAANNTDPNLANNTAQATNVAITPRLDVFTSVTGPASAALSSPVTYSVVTGNNGPSNALGLVQTVTLPAGATGITAPAGATIVGTTVTYTVPSLAPGSSVTNLISFTAPATGTGYTVAATVPTTNDATPANNSSSAATATPNVTPVARDVVNTAQTPEGNTAGALPISPLSATDANGNGTLVSYTILALPPATQGVLYVFNGATNVLLNTTNFPGLVLTPAQAAQLQFDPAPGFVGTVVFNYVATDNGNGNPAAALTSDAARYTIQVGQDNPSLYTNTVRTGTPAYTVGQAISNVFDPNGGKYTSAGLVDNGTNGNGLVSALLTPTTGPGSAAAPSGNPTNALPAGTAIDPTTGRIYVTNPAQLVPGTYTVNVTTTDIYGGTTTQPVTFSIGPRPLPVELLTFSATAVANRDAQLVWRTATERNNDHFDVERSLTGRDFAKFAEVAGQGNKLSPTDYTLTDANAAKLGATVYYRLKQVDTDGTAAYSPVQSVRFGQAAAPVIALFPNPATAAATLDLSALPTGSYTVCLTDLAGRLVRVLTLDGGQAHGLAVQELASGSYLLTVQGTADNAGLRFTKRLTKE